MHESHDLAPSALDWTSQDQSSIHCPGSIQPHGLLLVCTEPDLSIVQVSQNVSEVLGLPAAELLHKSLPELFTNDQLQTLQQCLSTDFESVNPLKLSLPQADAILSFDGILHRCGELLILELEPLQHQEVASFFDFYRLIRGPVTRMQQAATLQELSQLIVKEVRSLTGFDRVMIYRFREDGSGQVIAEETSDWQSLLGLHYPALDIPPPARQLFTQNRLRLIPQVAHQPVALLPEENPITHRPLDLSLSTLRSVSPCHLEYLTNMGAAASLTISLLKNKQLWGLIACHHQSQKWVPYEIRTACEFLGQVMSLELATQEETEDLDYQIELKSIHAQLVESIAQANTLIEGLVQTPTHLLTLLGAQGAAVGLADRLITLGQTPAEAEIHALLEWLDAEQFNDIFYTESLPKLYPAAVAFKAVASGLLALSISKVHKNYILWFRPEVIQTVDWGGNPYERMAGDEAEESRPLSPRRSFELWQETVRFTALPWKHCEINAALELRSTLLGLVVRKADQLARLNIELERSNNELDAFAYIASHDLKEPLRGIHNYSSFLIEDYGHVLKEDGVAKLQTLVGLTQRMEDLINSLLHFSRLGRVELLYQKTDFNALVHHVIEVLQLNLQYEGVEIRIPRPLPTLPCDRVQMDEVFTNLLSNAIKYNDKPQRWVEIGYLDAPTAAATVDQTTTETSPVFYIRDNGIGIRSKHLSTIFRIFKRLHGPKKYGGGTGAGLTIAKKIVERHGGQIWVESTYGEGSTFYFTLQT
jgi:two-component system, chemotaxis family, sensor kinase Cph1